MRPDVVNSPGARFLVSFILFRLACSLSLSLSFILSGFIYVLFGGSSFIRVFCLTIRRDLRGLLCLFMVQWNSFWAIWKQESLRDMFRRTLRWKGSKSPAIYFGDDVWTYGHLDAFSNKVANFLLEQNLQRGDRIALYLESSPAYVCIWLGAAKLEVATGLVNYNLRSDALVHSVGEIHPQAIIVGNNLRQAVEEAKLAELFPTCKIWYTEEAANTPSAATASTTNSTASFNVALAKSSSSAPPPLSPSKNPRQPVLFIFTSGTTGMPKAAIITKVRLILMSTGVHYGLRIRRSDIIYTALPLYHLAGGVIGVGQMLLHGTPIVVRPKFSASQFWKDCVKYRCTVVQYIGEVCRYLVSQPYTPEEHQHKVRLAFGNGLRPQIWKEFQERFRIAQIGEFYGATESNANFVNMDNTPNAIGFASRIIPNVYPVYLIRTDPITGEPIRNPNTNLCIVCEPLEEGQLIGRISTRNPTRMFDGYVNSKASEKKIVRNVFKPGDAWFTSGDILVQDELGYFYFRDRMGDTFRWRGENVSTQEVESIISKEMSQIDCVVYGVPVPMNEGKAGMAALGVDWHKLSDSEESNLLIRLNKVVTQKLPQYARPVFVRLCAQIETTGTFKMSKVALTQAGFDPTHIEDHIYLLDNRNKVYVRLTDELFKQIESGKLRL